MSLVEKGQKKPRTPKPASKPKRDFKLPKGYETNAQRKSAEEQPRDELGQWAKVNRKKLTSQANQKAKPVRPPSLDGMTTSSKETPKRSRSKVQRDKSLRETGMLPAKPKRGHDDIDTVITRYENKIKVLDNQYKKLKTAQDRYTKAVSLGYTPDDAANRARNASLGRQTITDVSPDIKANRDERKVAARMLGTLKKKDKQAQKALDRINEERFHVEKKVTEMERPTRPDIISKHPGHSDQSVHGRKHPDRLMAEGKENPYGPAKAKRKKSVIAQGGDRADKYREGMNRTSELPYRMSQEGRYRASLKSTRRLAEAHNDEVTQNMEAGMKMKSPKGKAIGEKWGEKEKKLKQDESAIRLKYAKEKYYENYPPKNVAKHEGHPDQSVHGKKGSGLSASAMQDGKQAAERVKRAMAIKPHKPAPMSAVQHQLRGMQHRDRAEASKPKGKVNESKTQEEKRKSDITSHRAKPSSKPEPYSQSPRVHGAIEGSNRDPRAPKKPRRKFNLSLGASAVDSYAKSKKYHSVKKDVEVEIAKVDNHKRLVFGWMYKATDEQGTPIVDRQGDFMLPEDVEKMAYAYVKDARTGGVMHLRSDVGKNDYPVHVSDLVESVVFDNDKVREMGLPEGSIPEGAWWVGYRVNNDAVWKGVLDGKYRAFSIHGTGKRIPADPVRKNEQGAPSPQPQQPAQTNVQQPSAPTAGQPQQAQRPRMPGRMKRKVTVKFRPVKPAKLDAQMATLAGKK